MPTCSLQAQQVSHNQVYHCSFNSIKLHHTSEHDSSLNTNNTLLTGLFQRAILQSGTALFSAHFGLARKGAIAIGKALNCKGEDSHQLLACFKATPVEDLVEAQSILSVRIFIAELKPRLNS
uniref:Carboxylesterase type B domain-containing protein n=1 Tax=Scylla olivacea TaxID=85551 RepID=A0A0P4WDU0_SCYOL